MDKEISIIDVINYDPELALSIIRNDKQKAEELLLEVAKRTIDMEVAWNLAKSASALGMNDFVEEACKIILDINPEFWYARELPKHASGYYSQINQDKFLENWFKNWKPKEKTFVEVGAFDGLHYSNVRRLSEKYGWEGLSIEPVFHNFEKMQKNYKQLPVKCLNIAVSDYDGETEINVSSYPHLPDWGSDVASLKEIDKEVWTNKYNAQWTKQKVKVKTLNTVLTEENYQNIGLLCIDTEGADLDVLKGLDLNRFRPEMIVVEYGKLRQPIIDYVVKHNYSAVFDNGQDIFFAAVNFSASSTINFAGKENIPPYDEIQVFAEYDLDKALHKDKNDIHNIVIVGAYDGYEISKMLQTYPNANFYAFEAHPDHYAKLKNNYNNIDRVKCYHLAVTAMPGEIYVHPTNIEAAASTLPLKNEIDKELNVDASQDPLNQYQINNLPKIKVAANALDNITELAGLEIDMLWIDVQGAELNVLKGASEMLKRTSSLFMEIWMTKTLYQGQCLAHEIRDFVAEYGFYLHGIGLDNQLANGTGNSIWLKGEKISQIEVESEIMETAEKTQIIESEEVAVSEIMDKFNPHLFEGDFLPTNINVPVKTVNALELLNYRRFDLAVKLIYADFREKNINSDFGQQIYSNHIEVINNYRELDASGKTGIMSFLHDFNNLLDNVKENGYADNSIIPIDREGTPIDGSHRVAACVYYNVDVPMAKFPIISYNYSYFNFLQAKFPLVYADACAYEYAKRKKNTYIATVFPSAEGKNDELIATLSKYGKIVYQKHIFLQKYGPLHLIRQIYRTEPWVGDWSNNFQGAQHKANMCFRKAGAVRTFLIESDSTEYMKKCKEEVRDLYGISNDSVHINDTHEETILLAQILFNENSVHFLNNADLKHFPNFYRLLEKYEQRFKKGDLDPDQFAIDGSAIMAAYGIREARDLDYLHFENEGVNFGAPGYIDSHNFEAKVHQSSIDDIVCNPQNHFYYYGIKFGSLDVIREMKAARGEAKDLNDVNLIDQLVSTPMQPMHKYNAGSIIDTSKKTKVVGLMPARNEENIIANALRAMAKITDAIVYLDDNSTDLTLEIVKSLKDECNIETIITKDNWFRDEPADRNRLLEEGRKIGGTHFLVLDADEIITSNAIEDNKLRIGIMKMKPGDVLMLNWIQLWRSTSQYRFDNSQWTNHYKDFAFCDDGKCSYESEFIHTRRTPGNLSGKVFRISGYETGVMHFQFVNWRNLLIKQAWYRILEKLRTPQKPVDAINERYAPSKDETNINLEQSPEEWFKHYDFLDLSVYDKDEVWRETQVVEWFNQYGTEPFADLDIWDIDWGVGIDIDPNLYLKPDSEIERITNEIISHIERGDLETAYNLLDVYTVQYPEAHTLSLLFAEVCIERNEIDEARKALGKVLKHQPANLRALNAFAVLEWREGNPEESLKYLLQAIKINPNDEIIVLNISDIFLAIGNKDDAMEILETYLQRNPGNEKVKATLKEIEDVDTYINDSEEAKAFKVSALVSVYSSMKYMQTCMEDLTRQTLFEKGELEIVIIDSNSPENEIDIIRPYLAKYPDQIIYERTQDRETIYRSWNRAIQKARGEYLTNANTDDAHRVDALEQMAKALDANPNVGMVYADTFLTNKENEKFEETTSLKRYDWPDYNLGTILSNFAFGPQPMWRKSVHETVGYFDDSLKIAADYEFFIRVCRNFGATHLRETLGLFLQREDSVSGSSNRNDTINETMQVLKHHRKDAALKEVYPSLTNNNLPQNIAYALFDYANLHIESPYPDYQRALELYEESMKTVNLAPMDLTEIQDKFFNNAGIILAASGQYDNAQEFFGKSKQAESDYNSRLLRELEKAGQNAFPVLFKISKVDNLVIRNSREAEGCLCDENMDIIGITNSNHDFSDVYIGNNGIEISEEEKERAIKCLPREIYENESSVSEVEKPKVPSIQDLTRIITKKKILYTMFGWNESGGGTYMPRAMAKYLAKQGYDVAVFYAGLNHPNEAKPYYFEKSEDSGVTLYGVFNRPRPFIIDNDPGLEIHDSQVAKLFNQVLEEFGPDMIHFHNFLGLSFSIAEIAYNKGIPSVYTPHNYHLIDPALYMIREDLKIWEDTEYFNNTLNKIENLELKEAYRQRFIYASSVVNKFTDYTLAISSRVRELLIDFGCLPSKISVVHQIPESVDRLTKLDKQYDNNTPLKFAFFGSVIPHKGVHKILNASHVLKPGLAEFYIFGEGNKLYIEELKKADTNNAFKWMGAYKQENLSEIAKDMDAAIIPSIWEEGAGLVILEAQALGLPVIASRIGGIPDFIKNNENGYLYPYNSEMNLASILTEIISKPKYLENMRKQSISDLAFKDFMSHITNVYKLLIQKDRPKSKELDFLI